MSNEYDQIRQRFIELLRTQIYKGGVVRVTRELSGLDTIGTHTVCVSFSGFDGKSVRRCAEISPDVLAAMLTEAVKNLIEAVQRSHERTAWLLEGAGQIEADVEGERK